MPTVSVKGLLLSIMGCWVFIVVVYYYFIVIVIVGNICCLIACGTCGILKRSWSDLMILFCVEEERVKERAETKERELK